MTLSNVLLMLLGAALVAIGVLAAALADRIRGLRAPRERHAIEVDDFDFDLPPPPAKPKVRRHASPSPADTIFVPDAPAPALGKDKQQSAVADEVVAALVAAGYKKAVATEAVWSCGHAERATVETWAATALRRCARGLS